MSILSSICPCKFNLKLNKPNYLIKRNEPIYHTHRPRTAFPIIFDTIKICSNSSLSRQKLFNAAHPSDAIFHCNIDWYKSPLEHSSKPMGYLHRAGLLAIANYTFMPVIVCVSIQATKYATYSVDLTPYLAVIGRCILYMVWRGDRLSAFWGWKRVF